MLGKSDDGVGERDGRKEKKRKIAGNDGVIAGILGADSQGKTADVESQRIQ